MADRHVHTTHLLTEVPMETVDAGAHGLVDLSLVQGVVAGATVATDSGVAWVAVLTVLTQVLLPADATERPRPVATRAVVAWRRVLCTLVYVHGTVVAFVACGRIGLQLASLIYSINIMGCCEEVGGNQLSLAGAAASIIFDMTNMCLQRQTQFVATKVLS